METADLYLEDIYHHDFIQLALADTGIYNVSRSSAAPFLTRGCNSFL